MARPRVGVLTSVHIPFDVRVFDKECRSLARAGYDVTLIVPWRRDDEREGVRVRGVPEPRGRAARMTRTAWHVYREALRLDADVYHFHDPELIPAGLLLRLRGKAVIYDIHEDVPRTLLSKPYLPRVARRLVGWVVEGIEGWAARHFSALVSATPAIRDRFAGLNARVVVVQNFPRLDEMSAASAGRWADRPSAVAYAGEISEARGIREMVRAMALLPAGLGARLELAGTFSPAALHADVARLPGWERVDYRGFLDRAGIARLLGRVRAGLVVIHPEPRYQVAYPIKMFEYMACGVPVIAADFPLWRRIVGEAGCGLLVDPRDPRAIARAIEYLLAHPEEAERMGRNGRVAAERQYNWRTEEQKLLELYRALVWPGGEPATADPRRRTGKDEYAPGVHGPEPGDRQTEAVMTEQKMGATSRRDFIPRSGAAGVPGPFRVWTR